MARRGWGFEVSCGVWGDYFLVVIDFGVEASNFMADTIIREIASIGFLVADL